MSLLLTYSKYEEFWYNVSPQEQLPLAGRVDLEIDIPSVHSAFKAIANAPSEQAATALVAEILRSNPNSFHSLRQFVGISDKRAYLDLSYICSRTPHPAGGKSLCGCQPWTLARHPMGFFLGSLGGRRGAAVQQRLADIVATYLLRHGLLEAANGFAEMSQGALEMLYARLISPKEYQMKAAKRRGHGCEATLARILEECGADVLPEGKAENPMGSSDLHVDLVTMDIAQRQARVTFPFDLLVMSGSKVAVMIQSLIHTSDPGQYGVNKSDETVLISGKIKEWRHVNHSNSLPELWGLVDGVGFSENKTDTIEKLIDHFDHFVQIKTAYKAPLRLHALGLIRVQAIKFSPEYTTGDIQLIASQYCPLDVRILEWHEQPDPDWHEVECGRAAVYV